MTPLLIYIVLLFIILPFSTAVALFFIFALDSLIQGHDLPTSKRTIKVLVKTISEYQVKANNFYDLGCSRGTLAIAVKKRLPELKVYGIDNSSIRIFFSKLKALLLKRNINFKKQDIFNTDLRNADIVYTYLWYDIMPPLEKKLEKELKKGAIIITNTSKFPNWKPAQKVATHPTPLKDPDFETLFVYIKG